MIMSFPDFGIYPEELRKANRLIISIAKNYNLTENDLDDADDIAKDIINIKLKEEKYPLDKLTNTINLCRLREIIQKASEKNNLPITDFNFDADGSDIWATYKNKPIEIEQLITEPAEKMPYNFRFYPVRHYRAVRNSAPAYRTLERTRQKKKRNKKAAQGSALRISHIPKKKGSIKHVYLYHQKQNCLL